MKLIVGLGKSGLSIAHYFLKTKNSIAFDIFEENVNCENLSLLKGITVFREMTPLQLQKYETIYLSPGVNPNLPLYATVKDKLSNDFNIFTEHCKKPFVAITGSNGKSTLVHLLEAALCAANYRTIAIGNNGVPMLDHIDDEIDFFVLELSSYQLELAKPFLCEVGYVSNISQDHLDRHGSIEHYAAIKETLYQHCRYAVINEDDEFCRKMHVNTEQVLKIGLTHAGATGWLPFIGDTLPPTLKMIGQHNQHNALAVMAICECLKINRQLVMQAIADFPGLEHRCEFVLEKNNITWWNDSKGTNVASTITAIHGLSEMVTGKLIVILGGQGKGQDFSELVEKLKNKTRAVILLGECKRDLEKLFIEDWASARVTRSENIVVVDTLKQAIDAAKKYAQAGDAVLLSPACASLDMFKNYEDRGKQFKMIVKSKLTV